MDWVDGVTYKDQVSYMLNLNDMDRPHWSKNKLLREKYEPQLQKKIKIEEKEDDEELESTLIITK